MINAALPLYVWERRVDGGEPGSISIPPVLLQESALSLYRCSAAFQITEKTHQTLQFGFTPSTPPPELSVSSLWTQYLHSESLFWGVSASSDQVLAASILRTCQKCRWICACLIVTVLLCFRGADEGRLVWIRLVNLSVELVGADFKTHHVFKSFVLRKAAKSFWGHYLK